MILDDLFEQRPLPAHIKASDLPPGMRPRLTMRDIEKERPRGAYRYRVMPGTPGESPKDFMDLPGAEQYAQAVKGRVQPLEEQADDPDVQRGMVNLNNIEKLMNTNQKVLIQNETGRPAYQIELPVDKQWLISHAQEWIDAGKAADLYKMMGTTAGFDFLLAAWQKEDVMRNKRQRDTRPEEPDLFSARQGGGPKAPRYQDESQHAQKKTSDLEEAPQGARGRTERMMSKMRARQPQATSDLEALAYELEDAERRDSQELNKLEKEVDDLETDIKGELQKRIATLTRRRGGIQQAAAADTKIDATLDQLAKVNDQQQRDIDSLNKAVASLGQRPTATMAVGAREPAKAAEPAAPRIEVPRTSRTKEIEPTEKDTFGKAIVAPLQQPAPLATQASLDVDQPPAGEQAPKDLAPAPTGQIITPDIKSWRAKQDEKVAEQGVKSWWQQFKSDVKTVRGLQQQMKAARQADKTPPASSDPADTAPIQPEQPASSGQLIVPGGYKTRTSKQQAAMQSEIEQARQALPAGWQPGQPIRLGKQIITPKDPNYQSIAAALAKRPVAEKKKPVPTNPDLWSRAKSAARSKFDVYPSAYANAWAAKWYKSKGGGWRMGKPKKK